MTLPILSALPRDASNHRRFGHHKSGVASRDGRVRLIKIVAARESRVMARSLCLGVKTTGAQHFHQLTGKWTYYVVSAKESRELRTNKMSVTRFLHSHTDGSNPS
jgi:hypothetical protein